MGYKAMTPDAIEEKVKNIIFDSMLLLNIKYMPSLPQIRKLKEVAGIGGNKAANFIDLQGGVTHWREHFKLESRMEYRRRTNA